MADATRDGERRRRGRPSAGEERGDSRAQLLAAAGRVFAAKGYRAATVDGIVAAAGLSKGTFYWNFSSKEELFLALLEERIDRPVRALMAITRDAPADRPTAGAVDEGLGRILIDERETLMLLHDYWAAAVRDERLAERYRARQQTLREVLAEALRSRHEKTGVPLAIPAPDLATAFIALAEGLSAEALIEPDAVGPGLYAEILSLVYDGMVLRATG
jgi:AcrR family transcriptional regulator